MGLIFEDDFIEVYFRDGPADQTMITFNPVFQPADGKTFWAQSVADRLNIRSIGIMAKSPDWFPQPRMEAVLDVVRPLRTGRILAYGFSMGAYAALKYSAALEADIVIAFSPQATISPIEIPNNTYQQYFKVELHADMSIKRADLNGRGYIFFDNYFAEDCHQVALIPNWPGRREIKIPYVRHGTGVVPTKTQVIMAVFEDCLRDDVRSLRSLMRNAKRNNWAAYFGVAMYCVEKRKFAQVWRFAFRAAEMAAPPNQLAHLYAVFSVRLTQYRLYSEALEAVKQALSYAPDDPRLLHMVREASDRLAAAFAMPPPMVSNTPMMAVSANAIT